MLNLIQTLAQFAHLVIEFGDLGEAVHQVLDAKSINSYPWTLAVSGRSEVDFQALRNDVQQMLAGSRATEELNTAGVVYYRAGTYEQAVQLLSEAASQRTGPSVVYDQIFLAMAHRQHGNQAEAQEYIGQGCGMGHCTTATQGLWKTNTCHVRFATDSVKRLAGHRRRAEHPIFQLQGRLPEFCEAVNLVRNGLNRDRCTIH